MQHTPTLTVQYDADSDPETEAYDVEVDCGGREVYWARVQVDWIYTYSDESDLSLVRWEKMRDDGYADELPLADAKPHRDAVLEAVHAAVKEARDD